MNAPHLGALLLVSSKLQQLELKHVFVGGAVAPLLVDSVELSDIRPTEDVDVIVELATGGDYAKTKDTLRRAGFQHDMPEGAPMCRWKINGVIVDIMPERGAQMGLNTRWFKEALDSAQEVIVDEVTLRVVSAPLFLATKLEAFADRGQGDMFFSHDLEDILAVVDGRSSIEKEVFNCPAPVRSHISGQYRRLLKTGDFLDALPGYLPGDEGSQARLPNLRARLEQIAQF